MPKINVYLPDDLATAVRHAGVPVSSVCQHALADAVEASGEPVDTNPSRLTDRARQAVDHARAASGTTVDLLDGIAGEGANLAISVLTALDVEPADIVAEVHALAKRHRPAAGSLDAALERATREAATLGHNYVGCEHLLLGLAAGTDELVATTLAQVGADVETLRRAVRCAMAGYAHARATLTYSGLSAPIRAALDDIRQRLGRLESS